MKKLKSCKINNKKSKTIHIQSQIIPKQPKIKQIESIHTVVLQSPANPSYKMIKHYQKSEKYHQLTPVPDYMEKILINFLLSRSVTKTQDYFLLKIQNKDKINGLKVQKEILVIIANVKNK